ncbi:MAG: cation:proton antiporter [Cyanobacteria bacterium P01_D01_bin.105]
MQPITVVWIALPLFLGFAIYLFPPLSRILAAIIALASAAYGLFHILSPTATTFTFVDSFGVTLSVDALSGYFVLTNALVTMAVVFYSWTSSKTAFFFAQVAFLHGSMNAVFICADFMSLYVALEVIGIAAFLLIAYPRGDRSIWIGLRYLFISNTAMLFYLLGAVQVYRANQSFAFAGLENAPAEAIALVFLGLLSKGGLFISGLWLPQTHANAETSVSALLSGVVVKTGVFPLVRCALLLEEITPMVKLFSVGTAVLGTSCAIFEKDTKRMLAWSSLSQMGFILVAPTVAGLYALGHGLAKAALFLTAGNLPSRQFSVLHHQPMARSLWIVTTVAGLSICGFPLLVGFGAKSLTLKSLDGWAEIAINIAAVGTAIAFAKFICLPFSKGSAAKVSTGFWAAAALLLATLVAAGAFSWESYTAANMLKAFATVAGGGVLYSLFVPRLTTERVASRMELGLTLPASLERLDHIIGAMVLMLLFLFWWIVP